MRDRVTRITVGAALAALVASLAVVLTAPGTREAVPAPRAAYRICPLADCARYPQPAQVRGITLDTLENYVLYLKSARAQIRASRAWDANTVRLQIVQDKMVGERGHKFSPRYAAVVSAIVRFALHRHLSVVLNAQTEITLGFVQNENLPTAATFAFWRYMTSLYGHDPRVVFDLFNEPRDCTWAHWRATFQPLVSYVRAHGSRNQLWVEGRWWGSTLQGAPLLAGQGIVYSYHHPGSPWPQSARHPEMSPATTAAWSQAFGYLAAQGVPVVDGEFVNFMGGYYWAHSTQTVTRYLEFLRYHHIGMVAWSLQPGVMTAASMTTPVSEPQGAGRLIMRYFHGSFGHQRALYAMAEG